MLDQLAGLDKALFFFINVSLANPVTDILMPLVTSDTFLRLLYLISALLIVWKGDTRLRWLLLFSVLVLALTDSISAQWLKPLIARPRPCQSLPIQQIHLLVDCGAGLSMPSSHASNAFGQAALFGLAFRKWRWSLWLFAAIIAVSRVFVGVHYPADVVIGSILGIAIGSAVYFLHVVAMKRVAHKNHPPTSAGGM
jgi:membrane-associated phospholipid phosphatase